MTGKYFCRCGAVALLLGAIFGGQVMAETVPFSADVSMGVEGQTMNGKMFVSGTNYRMDMEQGGQKISIVVDRGAGQTRVLIHDVKQYLNLKSDDPVSLMNDPFQSIIYTESFAQKKSLGIEKIDDHTCDKFQLTYQDQDLMTFWVSQQLDFPVKVLNNASKGTFVELSNIETGPLADDIFATPDGYAEMVAPGEEPVETPAWAANIQSAEELSPPFEKLLTAGQMVRVMVVPGQSIWFQAADQSIGKVEVRAIPFRDGMPVKTLNSYSNFAQKGIICERRPETEAEADEIIIRAFEGSMTVFAKYFPMQEDIVGAGENFAYEIKSADNIHARFVNIAEGETEFVISYTANGKELSNDIIGPETFRDYSLKPGEVATRTYSPSGDMMIVRVKKGSLLIKLGQYDSFKW